MMPEQTSAVLPFIIEVINIRIDQIEKYGVNLSVRNEKTISSIPLHLRGKEGEKALAAMVGGKSHKYFRTTNGARYVDQYSDGVAYESKVGYTTLTKRIKTQILKDVELIQTGQINSAEWHFFQVKLQV